MTDEEQIRQLFAKYCHLMDDRKYEEWTRLFTPEGAFESGHGARQTGREAILAYILQSHGSRRDRRTKHICFNSEIVVEGDEGSAVSDYFVFACTAPEPWAITSGGRNHDRLVRIEGQWLFAERLNESSRHA